MSSERSNLVSGRTWSARPATAGGWVGVLLALLCLVQINHARLHVLTESHLADFQGAVAESVAQDDGEPLDGDHHHPHPVADHSIQMFAKHQASHLVIHFLAAETSIQLTPPDAQVVRILCESGEALGESPPDPLQPRAPPLA